MKRVGVLMWVLLPLVGCKQWEPQAIQPPSITSASTKGPSLVQVEFAGLTSFVTDGGKTRLVFVRDGSHKVVLTVPDVYMTPVEKIFGAKSCVRHKTRPECSVSGIDEFEMRIVDTAGNGPKNPYTPLDFNKSVPGLKSKGVKAALRRPRHHSRSERKNLRLVSNERRRGHTRRIHLPWNVQR